MAAGKLVRAAVEILRILGEKRCAIAGGLAVNAHGFVRATRDVDVIVTFPLEEARRLLEQHGVKTRLFKGDALEGDFSCLKGVIGVEMGPGQIHGVPFDILPQLVPVEPERMIELTLRDQRMRVVDMETLIRLKLRAGGPYDLYDIAILVGLQPEWKDRARALSAHDPALADRLARMIDDPRLRAKVTDVKRQDSALREFAKRLGSRRGEGRGDRAR